ncbi:MAG: YihY family inner membrane protein [Nitrospirae bacterium]|nr:YihY family inner membrane protein [Nitrospirota bacterium]
MTAYYWFIICETIRHFRKNNGTLLASALTYQGLLSFIPFLLLIFLLLGKYIMSSDVVFLNFKKTISLFLPYSQDIIIKEARKLYIAEDHWSIASIAVCVWFTFPLVNGLKTLFSSVFKEKINRSFLRELASDVLSTFILMFLLVFLVLGEVIYIEIIKPIIKDINAYFDLIDVTGNFVLTLSGLILFYYLFIPVKVKLKHIVAGASLTAIAWIALRPSFAFLMHINPQMGFVFGSLKAIFVVFFWVYMYFYVLILGVELTASCSQIRLIAVESLLSLRTSKPGAKALARFTLSLRDGLPIYDKGVQADSFYYVVSGLVSLIEDGQPQVQKMSGDTFGVQEMLCNSTRAKTAVAKSDDVIIFPVHSNEFKALEKINPLIPLMIIKNHLIPVEKNKKSNPL